MKKGTKSSPTKASTLDDDPIPNVVNIVESLTSLESIVVRTTSPTDEGNPNKDLPNDLPISTKTTALNRGDVGSGTYPFEDPSNVPPPEIKTRIIVMGKKGAGC